MNVNDGKCSNTLFNEQIDAIRSAVSHAHLSAICSGKIWQMLALTEIDPARFTPAFEKVFLESLNADDPAILRAPSAKEVIDFMSNFFGVPRETLLSRQKVQFPKTAQFAPARLKKHQRAVVPEAAKAEGP